MLLGGTRRALATSGSAQRGDHIWRGGELAPADFVQVSVMADDIVTADVLATAIVAGGPAALDDITDRWDVDVLTVARNGRLMATPRFELSFSPWEGDRAGRAGSVTGSRAPNRSARGTFGTGMATHPHWILGPSSLTRSHE